MTVTVNRYKETGKWCEEFKYQSGIDVWDSLNIEKEIKAKFTIGCAFTFEAVDLKNGSLLKNKRICV